MDRVHRSHRLQCDSSKWHAGARRKWGHSQGAAATNQQQAGAAQGQPTGGMLTARSCSGADRQPERQYVKGGDDEARLAARSCSRPEVQPVRQDVLEGVRNRGGARHMRRTSWQSFHLFAHTASSCRASFSRSINVEKSCLNLWGQAGQLTHKLDEVG